MDAIMPNYTVLIQTVIFLVALVVIKFFILDPITEILKGRNERIEGAEQEAVRLEAEAASLDETYRAKLKEARSQAQLEKAKSREAALSEEKTILDQGRQEAQKNLADIGQQIKGEVTEARTMLKEQAAGLSRMLAEKLLGRAVQ